MGEKTELFGISIDRVDRFTAVRLLASELDCAAGEPSLVVTPNVDHVLRYQKSMEFQQAYKKARFVFADGKPVVWASRILGESLPETVTGSDLVPDLFDFLDESGRKTRVFLLGGLEGVPEKAAEHIRARWGAVEVCGLYSPPYGFEKNKEELDRIIGLIVESTPEVLIVGLGAPKQELWASSHLDRLDAKLVLCVGATIDFLAGVKARAPVFVQRMGLEWLYRAVQEPRRLAKRYAMNLIEFPVLLLKEYTKSAGK